MKRFIVTFIACFLAIVAAALFPLGIIAAKSGQPPSVEKGSWLVIDLNGPLPEYPPTAVLPIPFGAQETSLTTVLEGIEKATVDKRVAGVLIRVTGLDAGAATHEEIRNAIKRLRTSGKPVYAWGESLSPSEYLVASACDSIFLLPTGGMQWKGLAEVVPFAKNLLAKLDIKPDIDRIGRYKSAAEIVTRSDMSPESREVATRILSTFYQRLVTTAAAERHLAPADIEAAMQRVLFSAPEALDAHFVDGLLYWQGLEDRLKGTKDKLPTIDLDKYASVKRGSLGLEGKKKIAVVHAGGLIGGQRSGTNPFLGRTMGSETVVADLNSAMEDDKVAAVIFRIDSGGGEATTSDLIGHEVERVKSKKPIVVSMVDVAASGGYVIAYRGSAILADTTTITGSIGSISGKFDVRGFYDKLGITFDSVSAGPNALFWSPYEQWTDEQRAIHSKDHWESYKTWITDVARARGLAVADVDSIGRGREWTGEEAVPLKLIDGLGDFDAALARAKSLAGIPANAKVKIEHYPKRKSILEALASGNIPDAFDALLDRWAARRIADLNGTAEHRVAWSVADPMWR